MGGATVLDFALRYPERVEALVLVGSAVSGFEADVEPPKQWDELVAADEAGDLERVSELEVQIWVDGPGRRPEDVSATVRDLVREMNLIALKNEAFGHGEELPPEQPTVDRLVKIRAPSLVIVGDLDQPWTTARARPARKKTSERTEGRHAGRGPPTQHGATGGVQSDRAGLSREKNLTGYFTLMSVSFLVEPVAPPTSKGGRAGRNGAEPSSCLYSRRA